MNLRKIILPSIIIVLTIIYYFGFNYVYNSTRNQLLNQQIEAAHYQADLVSKLLSEKIEAGLSKEQAKNELQNSIESLQNDPIFICMFNTEGKEICHPNKKKIGTVITDTNSVVRSLSNIDIEENFKKVLSKNVSYGGIRKKTNKTELIYLSPVKNTDWIIASHSNVLKFNETLESLREKILMLFVIIWLSCIFIIYVFIYYYNSYNFKKITEKNYEIQADYYSELKSNIQNKQHNTPPTELIERFLADKGLTLTPIQINNIAFVYLENKITYIVELNGEKSTINLTLDEIYNSLNSALFYKASRQVIVSIKAIQKIEKYGITQLKVITNPICPVIVLISRAKISDFKNWVGKK